VHVVAPRIDDAVRAEGSIRLYEQPYAPDVLAGAVLVFACTDDAATNRQVAADARAAGAWVNVVDDPDGCDFFVPASMQRGRLRITVSTGGASPQLAGQIRRRLEELFDETYATLVEELGRARGEVLRRVADPDARRAVFETLCAECSIKLLGQRGVEAWRAWLERIIAHCGGASGSDRGPAD
jgi:precorrin-2 dehydrogenase/sirohydrochlorin ferrochelatase